MRAEILSSFQANELASYRFMDAGKRHEAAGSEKQDLLTAQQWSEQQWDCVHFSCLQRTTGGDTGGSQEFASQGRMLSMGNSLVLERALSERRRYLLL